MACFRRYLITLPYLNCRQLKYACVYRAMHRPIVQSKVLRLHVVCPSVTLVDQDHNHISRKSWKLIARTISPTSSLFVAKRPSTCSQGNMRKFQIWGRLEVGLEKVACWSTNPAISLKRVKIEEKLLWRAYGNSPTLFRTVPSTHLYASPSPLPQALLSQ